MIDFVLTNVVADLTLVGPSGLNDGLSTSTAKPCVVGRVVDVHQHLHHGTFRAVIETGQVDLTIFSSHTAPIFKVGDSVAVAHVFNRWDLAHRDITSDATRWTGRRADALAYLLTGKELGIAEAASDVPAILLDALPVGSGLHTAADRFRGQ